MGEELRSKGNLFQEPDSTLLLSSGCGRHWPDGRGIFHNDAGNFFCWVNEEDQMRIISMEKGDDIKRIFVRFATACNSVGKVLKGEGKDFMHNEPRNWSSCRRHAQAPSALWPQGLQDYLQAY